MTEPCDRGKLSLTDLERELGHFRRLIDERDARYEERDRRYEERFRSQETALLAALTAQKELVLQNSQANEKAILKAEEAQKGVNERGNEFRQSLDDYTRLMLPRPEAKLQFDRFEDDIKSLRESRDAGSGRQAVVQDWFLKAVALVALLVSLYAMVSQ